MLHYDTKERRANCRPSLGLEVPELILMPLSLHPESRLGSGGKDLVEPLWVFQLDA
jgi:hypothetical protein